MYIYAYIYASDSFKLVQGAHDVRVKEEKREKESREKSPVSSIEL